MARFAELQKEAEHSYSTYLDYSGVLHDPRAKLSLLKWIDACGTAIKCLTNPTPDDYTLLSKELELCVVQPIKCIHDAVWDRYEQLTGQTPIQAGWYPIYEHKDLANCFAVKNTLITQTNLIFRKLTGLTGLEYREIQPRDRSNN